ncbi:MAG: hypothetical protein R2909_21785 [Gemmatimonadales bacterium]
MPTTASSSATAASAPRTRSWTEREAVWSPTIWAMVWRLASGTSRSTAWTIRSSSASDGIAPASVWITRSRGQ